VRDLICEIVTVKLATLCYHLPSLSHCFTLSLKPTFSAVMP